LQVKTVASFLIALWIAVLVPVSSPLAEPIRGSSAQSAGPVEAEAAEKPEAEAQEPGLIADPLEPVNRAFFHFNDRLYFWVLKPVSSGYKLALPEALRNCIGNFFSNLFTPIRVANCLLQGKIKGAGREVLRFTVNSTAGFVGFNDVAGEELEIRGAEEDLGQTLGVYGLGPGIYINWPFLGPSSIRDTVGIVGDGFLNPVNHIVTSTDTNLAVKGFERVNQTSLRIGDYESFKRAALDPYVALKDAYHQSRERKVNR